MKTLLAWFGAFVLFLSVLEMIGVGCYGGGLI